MGITGVPFGRTELSLRLSWTEFGALASREGPEGPRVQGMPEKFDFHVFRKIFLQKNMKMVDEDGWMLEFRAENDTKWSG